MSFRSLPLVLSLGFVLACEPTSTGGAESGGAKSRGRKSRGAKSRGTKSRGEPGRRSEGNGTPSVSASSKAGSPEASAGEPPACVHVPETLDGGAAMRLRGVGAHAAAQLAGEHFRANLVVLGGSDKPIAKDVGLANVRTALEAIGSTTGLRASQTQGLWMLAPPTASGGAPSVGAACPKVDLTQYRGAAAYVAKLLSAACPAAAVKWDGGPITAWLREVPAHVVVGALTGGQEKKNIMPSVAGPRLGSGANKSCYEDRSRADGAKLHCDSLASIWLGGTAVGPMGTHALVVGAHPAVIKPGDRVGAPIDVTTETEVTVQQWTVKAITSRAVELVRAGTDHEKRATLEFPPPCKK